MNRIALANELVKIAKTIISSSKGTYEWFRSGITISTNQLSRVGGGSVFEQLHNGTRIQVVEWKKDVLDALEEIGIPNVKVVNESDGLSGGGRAGLIYSLFLSFDNVGIMLVNSDMLNAFYSVMKKKVIEENEENSMNNELVAKQLVKLARSLTALNSPWDAGTVATAVKEMSEEMTGASNDILRGNTSRGIQTLRNVAVTLEDIADGHEEFLKG